MTGKVSPDAMINSVGELHCEAYRVFISLGSLYCSKYTLR